VPNDIWRAGYVAHNANIPVQNPLPVQNPIRVDNATLAQLHEYARQKITNNAIRIVHRDEQRATVFNVGDFVRINLLALNSETRRVKKNGIGWSKVAVRFTPEVYRVSHVIPPTPLEQRGYNLVLVGVVGNQIQNPAVGNQDLQLITHQNGQRRKFYASQLTKVEFPNNNMNNANHSTLNPNTRFRAYYINRTRANWNPNNQND